MPIYPTKRCGGCKNLRHVSKFYPNVRRRDGLHNECKQCSKARANAWQKANPDVVRRKNQEGRIKKRASGDVRFAIMKRLGSSRELAKKRGYVPCSSTIDELVPLFTTTCQICQTVDARIHLDHCHETGRFRGFICNACNTLIGCAKDDPVILMSAIKYLVGVEFHSESWDVGVTL